MKKVKYQIKDLKSKVFKLAHFLKTVHNLTISESLQQAWKVFKLRSLMHQGAIDFSFLKKDNTLKETKGTLRNLPQEIFKGSNQFANDLGTFRYWDLESSDFRAFKVNNLLSINF